MSAFSDVRTIAPQQIWNGLTGRTVHGEQLTLSLIELDPESKVPEHSHPNEQVGILISGSMTFRVGDETKELGPGETWIILADVPHSVIAGPDGAVVIEVFAPPRSDWLDIETSAPSPGRWP